MTGNGFHALLAQAGKEWDVIEHVGFYFITSRALRACIALRRLEAPFPAGARGVTIRSYLPGLFLGLVAGIAGIFMSLSPLGLDFEERFGLDGLFLLRGPRAAPADVVVISLDNTSARRFGLPNEPRKWPRALHAQLLDNITRAGAAAVGFDIHFQEGRDKAQDARLGSALQRAGNVVLFEYLKKEAQPLTDSAGRTTGALLTERLIPPLPQLARAAAATAPFPLPKVPVKVSQFWLFKGGAGDPPTLPVVMFQLYRLDLYADLRRLLLRLNPAAGTLPADAATILRERTLRAVMEHLRALLRHPDVSERLEGLIAADKTLTPEKRHKLGALLRIYRDRDSRYLNYYGPPRSITTLNYHDVWQARAPLDLKGKLVLIGFSERLQPEQKDGFYTVYSQETSGLDISGVEIAATALANMLEDNPVQMLSASKQAILVLGWGMLIGLLAMWRRTNVAMALIAALSGLYLAIAVQWFSAHALWLPLVVPLTIQLPAVLFGALLWHYREASYERNRIRQAFRNYLPERAVTALARDLSAIPGGELLHGVCLATDAARYTALAERMAPVELAALMNRYYESLFEPVRRHGGFVSDVVGDAMLAVWAQVKPDIAQRRHACSAAVDVAEQAEHFSQSLESQGLSTRIGVHAGQILLGHIGAGDHFEYRAVGDIVNTAARLQTLNKTLGTRVLASRETTDGLHEFRVRELGAFRLPGKSLPTAIVELRGYAGSVETAEVELMQAFASTLAAFRAHQFSAAHAGFADILKCFPLDGPTRYYLLLCERYGAQSPATNWDGVINITDAGQI